MKPKGYRTYEERPFNMAQLLLERLDRRMDEGNMAASDGDVFKWYKLLRAIYSSVVFKLSDDEKSKCNSILNAVKGKILTAIQQGKQEYYLYVEQELKALEEELVILMYKYELYYPIYTQKNWQEIAMEEDI